jgi:O-antigen ligase
MNRTQYEFISRDFVPSTGNLPSASGLIGTLGHACEIATRWDIVVAATLMSLVSFSLPGRENLGASGGLDLIALAKLGIRFSAFAWFGSILLMYCVSSLSLRAKQLDQPISEVIAEFVWCGRWTDPLLLPWWCFAAWSLVTVTWSPLFSVSLGQWLGLIALLAFSQVISNRYAVAKSFQWQTLAIQLSVVLTVYSLMVLIAHVVAPEASGLDRSIRFDGTNGFFHPTAVGATSSLGLTLAGLLFLRRVTANIPILLSMMALHLVVLYLSASRSALTMAVVAGLICFLFLMSRRMQALFLFLGGTGLLFSVILDPGFELASVGIRDASEYIKRGQSADQLLQVSGRAELWQAVWEQVEISPFVGHGYFVTSSTGKLDVWNGPSNEDAHNAGLQVLVSTGIVGTVFFAWALLATVHHFVRCLQVMMKTRVFRIALTSRSRAAPLAQILAHPKIERDFIAFAIVVELWFLGWSQACASFLGPIRPEVVAFFGILGLVSAHARWIAIESSTHEFSQS